MNPIEKILRIVIVVIFVITTVLSLVSCGAKTPMERHIDYILRDHNDNCQYEMGECPQVECNHSK